MEFCVPYGHFIIDAKVGSQFFQAYGIFKNPTTFKTFENAYIFVFSYDFLLSNFKQSFPL